MFSALRGKAFEDRAWELSERAKDISGRAIAMGPAGAWRDVPISRNSEVERGEWDITGPTAPPLPPQPTEYHVPLRDESLSSSPSRLPPPTSPSQFSSAAEPWLSLDEGGGGHQQGRRAPANGRGGVGATQTGGVAVSPFPTAPTSLIREDGSLYPPLMTGGGTRDRVEEQQQQQRRQRRWKDDDDDEDDDMSTRPPSASPAAGNWGREIAEGGGRTASEGSVPYYLPVGSGSGGAERAREGGRGGKHKARVSAGTSGTEDDWNAPQPLLIGSTSRPQESRGRGGSSVEGGARTARGGGGRAGARQGGGGSPSSSSNAGGRESPYGTEQGYSRGVPDDSSSGGRRKPKGDRVCCRRCTWLVPAIVIACCVVFVISMYRNNCPENGGAAANKCVLPSLGRFSFEPLKMNPMIGPLAETLLNFGALETELLRKRHKNKYRLFSYVWLHAGVVHLVLNMLGVLVIGLRLEQEFGAWRTLLVYLVSAFGGSLMSALLLAGGVIVVGASGALFGLLGATLAELIVNWTIYGRRISTLFTLIFLIVVNLLVGLTPHVDNFSHIGGFVSGVLLGFVFLVKPQFGYLADNIQLKYNGYKDYTVYPVPPLPTDDPYVIRSGAPPKRKHNQFQRTMRCIAFALLLFGFASATAFVLLNVDGNKACSWCKYMDCVDTRYWDCHRQSSSYSSTYPISDDVLACAADLNVPPQRLIVQASRLLDVVVHFGGRVGGHSSSAWCSWF
ncbi:hypothetical protein CBR_g57074 [Chara braunii]|uniref:RHOMBOID-like protein n=1 Tax=Chara braunii TaxID=69332 RepID=A0A388K805_CHABU|nr:hypothetical protein CBR_g57074 [Chara braunii]|eukprot:GBG66195.1 hypothetical protein CBR_g57074 [Chara braunii]